MGAATPCVLAYGNLSIVSATDDLDFGRSSASSDDCSILPTLNTLQERAPCASYTRVQALPDFRLR